MSILIQDEETMEILRRVKEVATTFGNYAPFSFCKQIEEYLDALLIMERGRVLYKGNSPQVPLRSRVVSYLMRIADAEKYCSTTLFLAVYLYDRFSDYHDIMNKQIHMVAITCLVIAAKLEEIDILTPKIRKLKKYIPIGNGAEFSYKLFVCFERFILNFFDFKILVPTEVNFLELYLLFALDGAATTIVQNNNNNYYPESACEHNKYDDSQTSGGPKYYDRLLGKIHNSSMRVLQHLLKYEPTRMYPPSLIAAAALMYARREVGLNFWTTRLNVVTSYGIRHVFICLKYFIEPMIFANSPHRPVYQDPTFVVSV